ncbi:SDR family oxidoreductase [Mesorhizobium sp. IMUNJ 23232]|uniref:SDR family oxidoreductase n=1 Tax=Mesorhizobium sp. IMUNJ 23232 TaxID=3376064 RepID=UPI0037B4A29E
MDLFDLSGEVAVVTGAGSGIGQAIAIGLAEAGADVACFGHASKGGLEETAARITALGRKALVLTGSVTSEENLTAAIARIEGELGPLSVAVNNAGIGGSDPADTMPIEKWDRIYDVNVKGVFLSCQAQARVMFARNKGSIINIASISGSIVNRGLTQAHYNSSKAAVIHLSKSLAMEWVGHGLRVNIISPGYTLTPMNQGERNKVFAESTPMGRLAESEEMVGPAVFLASRASSYVTGLDLLVDGGFVCW